MWLWSFVRLPETLHPEWRRALDVRAIGGAVRAATTDRLSLGYTVALAAIFGGLTAYIASVQQIVFDAFARADDDRARLRRGRRADGGRELGQFAGGRQVRPAPGRAFGADRRSSSITAGHALLAFAIDEPLWLFATLMGLTMAAFAFTTSNLSRWR